MQTHKVVDINVEALCYQSFPCQHRVEITYNDGTTEELGLMCSREIGPLFDRYNLDASEWMKHFWSQ
jgi:hypothetical protein